MPDEITHHCILCFSERPPEELVGGLCQECRQNQSQPQKPDDEDSRAFMYGL